MQVSIPATDLRSNEILQSIRGMFAEKGFDGASMQDLARAAGMSVGNFYRYFPSKAAIVEAIVNRDLNEVEKDFSDVMEASDMLAAIRRKLHERIESEMCSDDGPLWAEMTAAAFRKPELAEATQRMERTVTRFLLTVFAKVSGLPEQEAAMKFSAHAAFIMLLMKSSACSFKMPDADQIALKGLILRTLDGVLDEIANSAVKG
jgi:AcrR family transcriptional regulator